MLISILLLLIVAAGGLALTYLVANDKRLMWRLAAGVVVGSAVCGTVAFVISSALGFGVASCIASLIVTGLPLLLFADSERRNKLLKDWAKAKGRLQGGTFDRFTAFAYYAFFVIVFWLFFSQAMYQTPLGIFTGGSNNLGDLPFHLGAIFGFTEGNNFPPQNPSFSGARFTYPFVADLFTSVFVKLGADVINAMFVQNLALAMSLLILLESFAAKITGSKLAGRIAPILLFFSGGLGFVWFFKDAFEQTGGIWQFLWNLPRDYTIGDQFRWGNSLVVLFLTQRSLLLGMPLTILALGYLWKVFATEDTENSENTASSLFTLYPFLIGLLAGTLPLIHLHSLAVLFVVTAFLLAFRPAKWRQFVAFGIGVCVIAVPELIWAMSDSATEATKFIGWHFGWERGQTNVIWFWIKNTGIVIPVVLASGWLIFAKSRKTSDAEAQTPASQSHTVTLLLFCVPFIFLFIVSNTVKLAPWEWDNIKVLIYAFVGLLPVVAYGLAWCWEQSSAYRAVACVAIAILTLAGGLDVWRTMTGQSKINVFDIDAVRLAEQLKVKTAPDALFLNAPTYNSAIVLSGRRSFMRYSGHLSSHGIDYLPREDEVKRIYAGGGVADILLKKNSIDYVLVSPEERSTLSASDEFFSRYPVIAESGQYRVYKIK